VLRVAQLLQEYERVLATWRSVLTVGLAVIGDPDALKQVLLILLDNALKFTPRKVMRRGPHGGAGWAWP
jgi:signal transduction histidine kinase